MIVQIGIQIGIWGGNGMKQWDGIINEYLGTLIVKKEFHFKYNGMKIELNG